MTHLYLRDLDTQAATSLHIVADWIAAAPGPVLDLGMGPGSLGRYLSTHLGISAPLDGVTHNAAEAALARPFYRQTYVADLEHCALDALLGHRTYRWVVCADVLEHLREPDRLLEHIQRVLQPEGELIVSIPNVGYAGLVAELLQGQWRYREEGLLDRTHMRFFTHDSLLSWLHSCGWHVAQERDVRVPLHASEFRPTWEAMPSVLRRHLLNRPHATSYQFVLRCVPLARAQAHAALVLPPDPAGDSSAAPTFVVEAFLDDGAGFREELKARAHASLGVWQQTVRLPIPPRPGGEPWVRVRLDPSDHEGLLVLHALAVRIGNGAQPAWSWLASSDEHAAETLRPWLAGDCAWASPALLTPHAVLLVNGSDPHIHLPLPESVLNGLGTGGGVLEITLSSPMSPEGLMLSRSLCSRTSGTDRNVQHPDNTAPALPTDHPHAVPPTQNAQPGSRPSETSTTRVRQLEQTVHHLTQVVSALQTALTATQPTPETTGQRSAPQHTEPNVTPLSSVPTPGEGQPHLNTTAGTPVVIIVPVYRGLDDTQRCLQSVLRASNQTPWRLIVIDDASPEPELRAWVQQWSEAQEPARVLLIRHEANRGFVHSVNEGMALAQGSDVVLLNSDTEVTAGWLDRLRSACYRAHDIGTATPWSNHATIFSYPHALEGGAPPPGWTADAMAQLCQRWLANQSVEVPTAHGFCMYIRADCLAAVGAFDADAFGLGYGEENDFCMRARLAGWKHVHALDAYVYHRGSVSFGAEREKRVQAAIAVIRQRYPDYEATIHRWIQDDPTGPARRLLDLARLADPDRARVLLVSHDGSGGTERHQRELAAALGGRATFVRLQPCPGGVAWSVDNGGTPQRWHYRVPDEYDQLLDDLRALRLDLVHFHHWHGLPTMLLELARHLGLPYDVTVHDHYSYCPQIHLSQDGTRYCGELGPAQCQQCLQRHPAPGGGRDIGAWRRLHAAFLQQARHIIVPSRDVATRIWRHFGLSTRFAPHDQLTRGADVEWPTPVAPTPRHGSRLRVVIIGALGPIKGADLIERTAALARQRNAPVEFHLIGYAYRSLRTAPQTALTCHGPYDDQDLPALLAWLQPDLVWLPSRVSETYSYTLSAALAAGLPVAATDLGALAERLDGRPWSWLLPVEADAQEWLELFVRLWQQHWSGQFSEVPVARSRGLPGTTAPQPAPLDYVTEYLPNPAGQPLNPTALAHGLHRAKRHLPPSQVGVRWRHRALVLLARWRAAPGLRAVAKRIPLPWARRVKRWLLR